jgi:hypothetical protein
MYSLTWFGEGQPAPDCDTLGTIPVPLGAECAHCWRKIEEYDIGIILPEFTGEGWIAYRPLHLHCVTRLLLGSIEHQRKKCPCYEEETKSTWGSFDRYRDPALDAIRAAFYLNSCHDTQVRIEHMRWEDPFSA